MRELALRLGTSIRLRVAMRRLEQGLVERDRVPWALFLGFLALYWTIGQLIQGFHGHDVYNYFFNADCPRIVGDLTRSHRQASSGIAVSSAHPLFLILLNPIAAPLARALGGADLLAALVLCHVAAAIANVVLYLTLRRLDVERWLATGAAATLGLSTTQLVFGSIVETYAFVGASLAACILVGVSTTSPGRSALAFVVPFGLNVVLAPFAVLAAPALWVGRLSFGKWCLRTLGLWVLLAALTLLLLKAQHDRYPDTNFFHQSYFEGYFVYSEKPADAHRLLHRWERLVPHVFAFDVVAPKPLFTGPPDRITTFMWEGRDEVARYTPRGGLVATLWIVALVVGTFKNFLPRSREGRSRLGVRLLCAGWLVGVLGLFTFFGDDLLLYSELWVGQVVLWVALGLSEITSPSWKRWGRWGAAVFVGLLLLNNLVFVDRMLHHYSR